jgi:hypothetical protein
MDILSVVCAIRLDHQSAERKSGMSSNPVVSRAKVRMVQKGALTERNRKIGGGQKFDHLPLHELKGLNINDFG